MQLTCQITKLG